MNTSKPGVDGRDNHRRRLSQSTVSDRRHRDTDRSLDRYPEISLAHHFRFASRSRRLSSNFWCSASASM